MSNASPSSKSSLAETLTEDFIFLTKFAAAGGCKRGKRLRRLRRQRPPVNQKQNPPGIAGFDQPVNHRYRCKGFPAAGRHGRSIILAFVVNQALFNRSNRLFLIVRRRPISLGSPLNQALLAA